MYTLELCKDENIKRTNAKRYDGDDANDYKNTETEFFIAFLIKGILQ